MGVVEWYGGTNNNGMNNDFGEIFCHHLIKVYKRDLGLIENLKGTVTSFVGLFLFVVGTQINCYMYNHGVNGSYGGFENVPKALVIIFIVCLVPQLLMATFIWSKNNIPLRTKEF